MRRGVVVVASAFGLAVLLGLYVIYTQRVLLELRREAKRTAGMYAQVYRALADTSDDKTTALFDLAMRIKESGVPLILTNAGGLPTDTANLPLPAVAFDDPRLLAYVRRLDLENPPVVDSALGTTIHYGNTKLVRGLRIIPPLYGALVVVLIFAGVYGLRERARADRERVWAGMARESAHQLGTPLSSLSGWVELLREREGDPMIDSALTHMTGDLERLERVAHRFERIGRPPRTQPLDVGELTSRVASYFRARVPTLAHAIQIVFHRDDGPLEVKGDAVLLEWALEAISKNAIDALAGRGGTVRLAAERIPSGQVRIRIADDGPGIPSALRSRIFRTGFTTKEGGWGIGLALAKRIVEGAHGGRLVLVPSDRGATFDVILPG
jgi:signal transduction histidine kinase